MTGGLRPDSCHETRQPARVGDLQMRTDRPTLVAKLASAVVRIREAGSQWEDRKESASRARPGPSAFTLESRRRAQVPRAPAPRAAHARDPRRDVPCLSVDFLTPLPEGRARPRRRGGESRPWSGGEVPHYPAADAGGS